MNVVRNSVLSAYEVNLLSRWTWTGPAQFLTIPDEWYDQLQSYFSKRTTKLSEDIPDLEVSNEGVRANNLAADMENQCGLLGQNVSLATDLEKVEQEQTPHRGTSR